MTSPVEPDADVALHRALGLTDDEAEAVAGHLGRRPNHLELAMYAVMWSEHCSYKSSRVHLGRLPTEGPQVLVGPGENAGVIDAGGGIAVAIRIESHNHPSAIEPYQGAATGVGGILRDIFTMGARPIAIMDPLRFGPLDDPRSRWIASGVVAGISGYGNSVGVPTVGGEVVFDACYADNPLVNVLCCGVLPADRLVLGAATGVGNVAVLLGSATGRDGIGGVSVLASAGFTDDAAAEEAKRPNVQVGDPFEEKRLIEACLELLDARLVVGIQDLGGAGLTCATSETASRGGVGMDVSVADVPQREAGMEAWEVLTSESQERMLAIVTPADLDAVLSVCARWEVRAAVVGKVTDSGRLRILSSFDPEAAVLADVPASTLHEDAPTYHRPLARPAWLDELAAADPGALPAPDDCGADLLSLLVDPAWVYRQYDHQLFLNTVVAPGGDAALLRLSAPGVRPPLAAAGSVAAGSVGAGSVAARSGDVVAGAGRAADAGWVAGAGRAADAGWVAGAGRAADAIALSTDGNGRWCALDPRAGTVAVVAESALNLACVGARPVALVNCLNFGNPEHPEVMWQLSEAIDGMSEACRALGIPVVGGNVSLYNESRGRDIDPTPVVGTLGLVDHLERRPPPAALAAGGRIVLLGPAAAGALDGSLAGSLWADKIRNHKGGELPPVDLPLHARLLAIVAGLVNAGTPAGIHDVSDGGVGVALAEMAIAGGTGFRVTGIESHAALFGEGRSRVLLCLPGSEAAGTDDVMADLVERADAAGLVAVELGAAGGDRLVVEGLVDVTVAEATAAARGVLDAALGLGGGAA